MGPFNGSNTDYTLKKGIYTGRLIVEESGGKALEAIANCGVLSRHQVSLICNTKIIGRLASKGYLDEYISKTSPPLYSLGKKGAEILGVEYKTWDTASLLRLAAANQLWVQIRKIWPDASWNIKGELPVVSVSGLSFAVASPRLMPRENFYTILAYNRIGNKRLLVVAASQEQAKELARSINPDSVRYTWDDLLKDGIVFYKYSSGKLVKDNFEKNFKKFLQKTIDENMVSSL